MRHHPSGARAALATATLLVLSACGYSAVPAEEPAYQGQSYPEAMRVLCDVDHLAGIGADEDPLSIGQKRTAFLQAHVDNPDGIYLRTLLSVKGAAEQAAELRAEAKELGLAGCALADDLEKNGMGGLSP